MLATSVVNVRRDKYDVYIGRPHQMIPKAEWSDWGNPFHIGKDGTREEVVGKYRAWLLAKLQEDGELWERIHAVLGGKRLGCFCAPLPCHGDVLAEIADQGLNLKSKEAIPA